MFCVSDMLTLTLQCFDSPLLFLLRISHYSVVISLLQTVMLVTLCCIETENIVCGNFETRRSSLLASRHTIALSNHCWNEVVSTKNGEDS